MANFVNYPGVYRHKSGEIWRPEDTPQNLEITDINLETGRYGSKSGDSRIIQESWQPCKVSLLFIEIDFLFSLQVT